MSNTAHSVTEADLALEFVTQLGGDLQDDSCPAEIRQIGRTINKWRTQIAAWHQAHVSNGPTEAANNLIKVVKSIAFGFTSFRNYRSPILLHAGKPNWDLLTTITSTHPSNPMRRSSLRRQLSFWAIRRLP